MKNFNTFIAKSVLISMVVAVGLVMSPASLANEDTQRFCTKLGPISQGMISGMQNKKLPAIKNRPIDKSKFKALRLETDRKRQELFAKLYEKYPSQANKQALDEYKSSIDKSFEMRHQKVDSIRENFINSVNQLASSYNYSTAELESKVITSVQAASDMAQTKCSQGLDQDLIRTSYRQSIISARDSFIANKTIKELDNRKIENLIEQRNSDIESVHNQFLSMIKEAKVRLIAALK